MMSREFLLKTADVLEKLAEYLDQEEARRQEDIHAAQTKIAEDLKERFSNKTGDTLPNNLFEKIAADKDIADVFDKLAGREETPDNFGEASDIRDNNNSGTLTSRKDQIKEASINADDQFMNWIMS
ncbi:MAG: hypothetical protein PVI90_00260 [Desulfobacteraceae bacterium]|jgi:hypothetical protein